MGLGAAISIEGGLTKAYGDRVAVDRVSLSVKAGEFVTLLGSSGSGKTTTLMMVAGFVTPDHGRICIGERDIANLPPEKRGLGVVFQNYALFPHYTVYDNVAFPLRLRKVKRPEIKRRIADILSLVGLNGYEEQRIDQLSGGQQQRVALARAIVFAPPVLLMDEPLGALDRKLRDQLQTEIKRIQRDLGVTVLYVTHDQEEALALSDRIAIMDKGRIVQTGSSDEVYECPNSPFVASFLGESNFIPVEAVATEGRKVRVRAKNSDDASFSGLLVGEAREAEDLVAMIRPEAFRSSESQGLENRIKGRLVLREFLGPTVRLTVDSEVGELTVRMSRLEFDRELTRGCLMDLHWGVESTSVFAKR